MTDILDHTDQACALLEDAMERVERSLEYWHGLRVGDYVMVRYNPKKWGRIEDVVIKHPGGDIKAKPYSQFLIRLWDGSFIEEHPEYVCKAKPPKMKVVS